MSLRLKVIESHEGEGTFPLFEKGTFVALQEQCPDYEHWFPCTIDGHETYISEYLLEGDRLLADYNPTELAAEIGTELVLIALYGAWLRVENPATQEKGWFPASKVISV